MENDLKEIGVTIWQARTGLVTIGQRDCLVLVPAAYLRQFIREVGACVKQLVPDNDDTR